MIKLVYIELYKLVRQPRTWITFLVLFVIMGLVNFGIYTEGENMFELLLKPLSRQFFIQGNIINGYLISYLSLNMLWVHIPVLLVIVTADLVSGELDTGTIRILLCSTYTRTEWLLAKMFAAFAYILVFMIFAGMVMLIPSLLIFGAGDLIVFYNGLQVILNAEVMPKFIWALAYGTLGMITFSSISIMFSVLLKNSLAAILASLGVLIVSTMLQTFAFGVFESWKSILLTHHMAQWQQIFVKEMDLKSISFSVVVLLLHIFFATAISLFQFNRMKITQ